MGKIKIYRIWIMWDKLQGKLDESGRSDLAALCFFQKVRIQSMYWPLFAD